MHAIRNLQRTLVDKLNRYEEKYRSNINAVKLQIIQPLLTGVGWDLTDPDSVLPDHVIPIDTLDYAFFSEEKCIGFLLTSKDVKDVKRIQAICEHLNLEGGIITDGFVWSYINKKGDLWSFLTDDTTNPHAPFVPHILYLTPKNIQNLGNQIFLIVQTGKVQRLKGTWNSFSVSEEVATLIQKLEGKFINRAYHDHLDIDLSTAELQNFFKKFLVHSVIDNTPNSVLKVTMPDGKIILNKEAKKVLLETIQYIGIKKITNHLNIKVGTKKNDKGLSIPLYLIEKIAVGKTQELVEDGDEKYYVFTGSNNKMKLEQLVQIRQVPGFKEMRVEQLWI